MRNLSPKLIIGMTEDVIKSNCYMVNVSITKKFVNALMYECSFETEMGTFYLEFNETTIRLSLDIPGFNCSKPRVAIMDLDHNAYTCGNMPDAMKHTFVEKVLDDWTKSFNLIKEE